METSPEDAHRPRRAGPLVSHTGEVLSRAVAFQFALDPTLDQRALITKCAGAWRFAFNHHLARVKANLDVRAGERESGEPTMPSPSWSRFTFVNEFNACKNGQLDDSPACDDGTRGLSWRHEIPGDVFECASVDAAQALANWSDSKQGQRRGPRVGFSRFAAKGRVVRGWGGTRRSVLSLIEDVFVLWGGQVRAEPVVTGLRVLELWPVDRPRPQRRDRPRALATSRPSTRQYLTLSGLHREARGKSRSSPE